MFKLFRSLFSKLTLLKVSLVCLCGTSVACTVLLLVSFSTDDVSRILAAITGVGLQLSMYLFPNFATEYWSTVDSNRKRVKIGRSLFCWFGSLILFLVSVIASTTFFDNSVRETKHEVFQEQYAANSNSDLIITKKAQITSLERQIEAYIRLVDEDTNGDYRKRAIGTMSQLDELNDKLSKRMDELSRLMSSDVTIQAEQSLPWYYQDENARWMLFFIVALLIDGCGVGTILLIQEVKAKGTVDDFLNEQSELETNFLDQPFVSEPMNDLDLNGNYGDALADPFDPVGGNMLSAEVAFVNKDDFNQVQLDVYDKLRIPGNYEKPVLSKILTEFKGQLKQKEVRDIFALLLQEGTIKYENEARKAYLYC